MIDLNEFAKEVHRNAVDHGWWETERPFVEVIALIHSEISEALEEYRAGRPMVWYECDGGFVSPNHNEKVICEEYCTMYADGKCSTNMRNDKPEGIAVELIDMCIRILDWYGHRGGWSGLDEQALLIDAMAEIDDDVCSYDMPRLAAELHALVSWAYLSGFYLSVGIALLTACKWLKSKGLDPEKLMLEKHVYNKTRPYKHGGKVC